MDFDWNKFLTLAGDLRFPSGNAGMEARLRSSMSRGYYGLFHLVRRQLQAEGMRFDGGADVHQQVIQALVTSRDEQRLKLGRDLGRLRKMRNLADYDDEIDNIAMREAISLDLRGAALARFRSIVAA